MSVPITSIVQNTNNSWTFNWAATVPPIAINVVLYGRVLATVTSSAYTYSGTGFPDFPPPIEITPAQDLALSQQYVPFVYYQWYGEAGATNYLVQQYNGSSWSTVATIKEVGQWVYTYQSPVLNDGTTYQYQVVAVDSLNNQSTPRQFVQLIVTPPKPPDGKITIGYTKPNLTVVAS